MPAGTFTYSYDSQGNLSTTDLNGSPVQGTVWDTNDALPSVAEETGPSGMKLILRKTRKDPSRNCSWMDDSCWPHRDGAVSWLMRWLAMNPVMADRRLEGYRSQPSRIPRRRIRQP
jgi:hypothetical protein